MNQSLWIKHLGLTIPREGSLSDPSLYTLSAPVRGKMVNDAMNYYDVPGRYYHAMPHPIRMMNGHFDYWNTDATDALFLAILMHDAIYVPGMSPESEEMSMRLLPSLYYRITGERIPLKLCDDVYQLIYWTLPRVHVRDQRKATVFDNEGQAARLLDLDLTSMSDEWDTFVQTQDRIEREFAHTGSHVELVIASAGFLEQFIQKGFVYYTQSFAENNARAMRNLKALVQAIRVHKEYSWANMARRDPNALAAEYDQ